MKRKLGNIAVILFYGIGACLLVWLIYQNGVWPGGSDTMCHVYKGDILYKEILKGNFYPLIDPLWYNGVEMMRYWAPLPVYVLALCQALAGGDLFYGYLLFVGGVFFFGALVWLHIGGRHGRWKLGAFLGALWFFMPNNLYALFVEGNLPRSLCMIFLPWLTEQIWLYLTEKRWQNLLGILGCFLPIVLCHLGYAGMILLAVLLFLAVYLIRFGGLRKCLHILFALVLSVLILGVWVYPSLQGGITSTDSSQVMKTFFQSAAVSLNPFYRIQNGAWAAFYFGLAAFLAAVPGVLFGKNKSSVYFFSALLIFLCTTNAMYPIISHLPGSQYLWMLRFLSIALCMILFGLMLWHTLKKSWLRFFAFLLVLDVLPSMTLVTGDFSARPVEERMAEIDQYSLLSEAREITTQRIACMDLNALESTGAFLISDYGKPMAATFGAGWQSANTAENIVMLNEAMETGRYHYLFDRCLELGNDSVLIRIDQMKDGYLDLEKVKVAGEAVGYKLAAENEGYLLFHLDTWEQFGVISDYQAIGIGRASLSVTMDYPAMECGDSDNLNDYRFEELVKYRLVFLDGFTYDNKQKAEELVLRLSEAGVRVVIGADGIPVDEHTGVSSFLDVVCQPMLFSNGYPLLDTMDGVLDCDLFPEGYTSWRAMYLNGLDECWGKIDELEEELEFFGTVKNDNIVMIGLNLPYFYSLTRDEGVGRLLSHAMTISENQLPHRSTVPLEVEWEEDRIIIRSEYDNVNTTLAYHDIFDGAAEVAHRNNLTYVNRGETVIGLHYPYLKEGLLISVVSLLLTALFLVRVRMLWRGRYVEKVELTEVKRPVRGKTPCFEVTVPEGVRYRVTGVEWYDGEGGRMQPDSPFGEGRCQVRITLRVDEEEHFSGELRASVNGLNADSTQLQERDKAASVEMSYEVLDPFRYIRQPEDLEVFSGEKATVRWSISKMPQVGYLQILEGENWIICDTLPREAEWELSLELSGDGFGKASQDRYRLAYITGTGGLEYSREFTVKWKENGRMRILVTGVNGQLGHDVMNELAARGIEGMGTDLTPAYGGLQDGTAVTGMPYRQLDITDGGAAAELLRRERPDAVIHCAAYTAVDAAEENEAVCRRVNAEGTRSLALVCRELDIKMLYISTDYVFSGKGEHVWEPEDERAPESVYGQTKYEGELAVQELLEKYFIVRVAWVFGINGKNFVRTMLKLAESHDTIRVVNDQFGSPTYTLDLARLLADMIVTEKYGVYHATNEGICSWYDFACAIFQEAGVNVKVVPVTTEEYGAKAKRPANSRMSKEKLSENGFERLPEWRDALRRYIRELKA
ncbi:MAG: dTDP-4-dehydrorhamnose reductase [Lachnospiraceae bacterium]|jgi:dTDP-4-dehydrorhamnose reductase|nr:dTDP-4-dehydrorhamnose reductase [Lachnospiraceae bacterium]